MSLRLRVALIGWGAIGRTVAGLVENEPIDIVAVGVRNEALERQGLPPGAQLITDPTKLSELQLDVVAEAAGRDSVAQWGVPSLASGLDFIISSTSALADTDVLKLLTTTAVRSGAQAHVQTGALGGIDALASARLMGLDSVEHRIVKPPLAWKDTDAETLCDLDLLTKPVSFFSGSARQTASAFPKNANVAMTTALAGIGPDETVIHLVADPLATTNRHEIHAHGAFGSLDVSISNNPLPDNPKTSAMAALSLARALQNRSHTLMI